MKNTFTRVTAQWNDLIVKQSIDDVFASAKPKDKKTKQPDSEALDGVVSETEQKLDDEPIR